LRTWCAVACSQAKLGALLGQLKRKPEAVYFLAPVDPVALNIPAYFEVVKRPMDFGTVEKKLASGFEYFEPEVGPLCEACAGGEGAELLLTCWFGVWSSLAQDVAEDLRLVFSNSRLFNHNDPLGPVYKATNKLSDFFEAKWCV
jgi:hypothetical protein